MTGNELRQQVCSIINSWIGATKGSAKHLEILKIYNSHTPLAVGYTVQVNDAYCATTVSAAWIKAGVADYTGTECGVDRFIAIAKQKGIWVESDNYTPKIGDAICYVWSDGSNYASYDNTSSADHIGIVTKVNGNNFTVTEGNMSGGVTGTRNMTVNGKYIRGYICPDYDAIAKDLSGTNEISNNTSINSTNVSTPVYGIDVSEFNGSIDWNKVKSKGWEFAIIRSGYGKSYTDPYFEANIKGAIAAGLKIGIYHFSYALNVEGVKKEAAYVINLLKPYKDNITLPVFFDFEGDTVRYAKEQGVTLGKDAFNNHTVAFAEAIEAAGYKGGAYFNLSYLKNWVDQSKIGKYIQWYAQYNKTADWNGYDIWQYSSTGTISGISGRVDCNIMTADCWNKLVGGANKKIGWQRDSKGWWYSPDGDTYYADICKYITDAWYCFDKEGYMLHDTEFDYEGKSYVIDSDGRVTEKEKEPDTPVDNKDKRYYYLKDITENYYRPTIDKLIKKGILKGKEGEGENLVVDLSEDAVRILVMLDRAEVFGE